MPTTPLSPLILALMRQKQVDLWKLEASLVCITDKTKELVALLLRAKTRGPLGPASHQPPVTSLALFSGRPCLKGLRQSI